MEKLTLHEIQEIIDSRMVEVENQVQRIKDNACLWNTHKCIEEVDQLKDWVELLAKAYDAYDDKELDMVAEEAEQRWMTTSEIN